MAALCFISNDPKYLKVFIFSKRITTYRDMLICHDDDDDNNNNNLTKVGLWVVWSIEVSLV